MKLLSNEITQLLTAWSCGDESALDKLTPLVYADLHRLAAHYMRQERLDHTLQATALVHEAYLELCDWRSFPWQNSAQFIGIAARMMRRVLTDHARQHNAEKRGGGQRPLAISEAEDIAAAAPDLDLAALDEVLQKMEERYPQHAKIVELKFFGGLSVGEIAEMLKISEVTVRRNWKFAQAWLYGKLNASR